MHRWLKKAQDENVGDLHAYWHDQMEPSGARGFRNLFFLEVVTLANFASHFGFWFAFYLKVLTAKTPTPKFTARGKPRIKVYVVIIQSATRDLMTFLSSIKPRTLCVTYFDEAHGMDRTLWVLLRLLQYQDTFLRMWFIFMGTKSSIPYCAPGPNDSQFPLLFVFTRLIQDTVGSLRLIQEMARLLPPYVALGFDHHAIANAQEPRTVTMGKLQSIKHLAQYGRLL